MRHKSTFLLLPILLMMQLLAIYSYAKTGDTRKTYIVHIEDSMIRQIASPTIKLYAQSLLQSIYSPKPNRPNGIESHDDQQPPELLYTYETTMTAFAARLGPHHVKALETLNGVLLVAPDELLRLHTTHSPRFLGLEQGKGVWSPASLAVDVVVGVLDTGIWPEHVSFSGKGLPPVPSTWKGACEAGTNFSVANCNRKLVGARAFLKGYEAINGRVNETEDFRSARDSNGHGTHTASTAAGNSVPGASFFGLANGAASGVRFSSRVAAYKVCWAAGCASSDILAAIDQAVADGVDVISLSLGGLPRPYYADSMAISTLGAVRKGVFVSCSAGNSGPMAGTVGNMAPWMATVGASYMDRAFPVTIKLGNGRHFTGSSLYKGNPTSQLPLSYKETAGTSRVALFCVPGSLSPRLVKGRIVLCERGFNSRVEKGQVVKAAGGSGMILLNSASQGEELFGDAHVLPAAIVGAKAAKSIKGYLQMSNNSLTASLAFKGTVFGERAPVMAAFSSRGPSRVDPNMIKPDITAPGVNILAAWPPITSPTELKTDPRRVLYNIVSGTSMSCPHLSGTAALVRSVHRGWSPAAVKSALMTSAYVRDNRGASITDAFVAVNRSKRASPFALGSGHVDPERASDPGLVYDITWEEYMSYLCSLNYTNAQVSLLGRGNYTCNSKAARLFRSPGDLNYPSFSVLFDSKSEVRRAEASYMRTVTNVGPSHIRYVALVDEPKGVKVRVTPSVLTFRAAGEKLSYEVKFRGIRKRKVDAGTSYFGSLNWVGGENSYNVRSPIAVTWQ
ncbi:hypothetical protein V2J09_018303 [Rumex salicifolius]